MTGGATDPLIRRLGERLRAWPRPHRYRVALSGGADSSALLHGLSRLDLPAPLDALHLDHGLHSASARWADHCQDLCARLDVPLRVIPLRLQPHPGESLEARARAARRAALAGAMHPGDLLLMAHHREDQAETLLLALLRGAGPTGLAAMPELTPFGPGWLGRPLLEEGRRDLRAHLRRAGIPWIEDPSNADTAFDRNFLRQRVLPRLRARWPGLDRTLGRGARLCAEAEDLAQRQAGAALARCRGRHGLAIRPLITLDPPLAHAVLRRWIREQGLPRPDLAHLERIRREVLGAAPDRHPLVAWPGAEARRHRGELLVLPPLPPRPTDLDWPAGARELALPPGLGRLRLRRPPPGPLRVRFGVEGLRCRPQGRPHRRRLKQIFQEAGIPAWLRPYLPLVFAGETLLSLASITACDPGLRLEWRGHPWPTLIPIPADEV